MTLFYQNAYLTSFDAVVQQCTTYDADLFAVVLSDTAFYPQGGGQPGDTGYLNDVKVIDTRLCDGQIVHICHAPLTPGSAVHGMIDWNRRFRHMQYHTGEHIFSGIAHKQYGCNNVGFHLGSDCVTVDFDRPLTTNQISEIEYQTNQAVFANHPTVISYPSDIERSTLTYRSKKELTGTVRIVETGGCDLCACCGLHVAYSSEVGCVKVSTITPHRGGIRITLMIGWDALHDYQIKQDSVRAVSQILSAKPDEITQAVKRMTEKCDSYQTQIIHLHDQIFRLYAQQLPTDVPALWQFMDELNPIEIRRFADLLAEQCDWAAVFCSDTADTYQFAICSHKMDIRPLCQTLCDALNGRGGGKPAVAQGAVHATRTEIEAVLHTLNSQNHA